MVDVRATFSGFSSGALAYRTENAPSNNILLRPNALGAKLIFSSRIFLDLFKAYELFRVRQIRIECSPFLFFFRPSCVGKSDISAILARLRCDNKLCTLFCFLDLRNISTRCDHGGGLIGRNDINLGTRYVKFFSLVYLVVPFKVSEEVLVRRTA